MEALSRRSLFAGACAVLAIGSAEVPAAANTAVKKIAGGRLSVNLKAVPALSKYVAFNLQCPHQGITVGRSENGWVCSAHLSEFEPDGDLVLGPATTGLTRVPIKVSRGVATIG
jgi:Rieske Fe-S protein